MKSISFIMYLRFRRRELLVKEYNTLTRAQMVTVLPTPPKQSDDYKVVPYRLVPLPNGDTHDRTDLQVGIDVWSKMKIDKCALPLTFTPYYC